MKVTIIGGGGRVGSNAAFALQCAGIVSEIQILDANADLAAGEALDLLHGTSVIADQRIYAGDYARAADSDIFVITAGLRRKPDESRLDLINRNVSLFDGILASIKQAGFRKDALIFVVSNPVDILTQLAVFRLGLPWQQVLGLGTMLDTARFRSLIAESLNLAPTQVKALILGEHGDTMVPIWSSATAAGLPLEKFPGVSSNFQSQLFERTKTSGAEVIRRKGGAGWAVGITIAEVVHAIALDKRQLLPVSSLQQGKYGLRDVSISVPTVVGRAGVLDQVEVSLWPKELSGLQASARALQEIWSSATSAGLPLDKFPGVSANFQTQLFDRTKASGAEVIRRKGGAGWAVGITIAEVVHSIALDKRELLPVSSLQQGKYGLREVSISVPTVVGRAGVLDQVEIALWPKELSGLQASARALQGIWSQVRPR